MPEGTRGPGEAPAAAPGASHVVQADAADPPGRRSGGTLKRLLGRGADKGIVTEEKKGQLLSGVGELDEEGKRFCGDHTLERYLRARKGDVRKSTKMLSETLAWRKELSVDSMKAEDHMKYIDTGLMYMAGFDSRQRAIVVHRKRKEVLPHEEEDAFFKYIMFTFEMAQRSLKKGAQQWVHIMDLNGYDRRNSPSSKISLAVINALANHFPERLGDCYIVDAPTIFWVLYSAVWPFVDPVTRAKVHFVSTKAYAETGKRKDGKEDTSGFSQYYWAWASQMDKASYLKILEEANGDGIGA